MSSKRNPTSKLSRVRVGITVGDPSGIGPIITEKAVNKLKGLADFVIIGSLDKRDRSKFPPGKVLAASGLAALSYLDNAVDLIRKKEIDCLVTCPVSKEAINLAGVKFSGHTEYLAEAFGVKSCVMLLLNRRLKFSLLTRHIPLKDVPLALNEKEIFNNARITIAGLKDSFGIKTPRLAFCGLNPHASDNGVIGREENRLITPCLNKIKKKFKVMVDGPFSADVAVLKAFKGKYDCLFAPYHDQALIALKLTGADYGVNLTLGLPFVRTSPLHGTAFDIARTPQRAHPGSLIEAIKVAVECTLNQKKA